MIDDPGILAFLTFAAIVGGSIIGILIARWAAKHVNTATQRSNRDAP